MQEALTAVFGIGVLTVATVALLNVACLRIHDVQRTDGIEMGRILYAYVYDSVSAFEAREKLRNLPTLLGWAGVGAIGIMQSLYAAAYFTTCSNEQESIAIWNVITWASIVSYVVALLFVSAWVSNKVYGVLSEVHRG